MGIKDFFKRNSGDSKRGGHAAENVGGQKHQGSKRNNAKKIKRKPKGNGQ